MQEDLTWVLEGRLNSVLGSLQASGSGVSGETVGQGSDLGHRVGRHQARQNTAPGADSLSLADPGGHH